MARRSARPSAGSRSPRQVGPRRSHSSVHLRPEEPGPKALVGCLVPYGDASLLKAIETPRDDEAPVSAPSGFLKLLEAGVLLGRDDERHRLAVAAQLDGMLLGFGDDFGAVRLKVADLSDHGP